MNGTRYIQEVKTDSLMRGSAHSPESVSSPSATARYENGAGPILIVPYVWIGDFVRCHSVVKLINARWPGRAVDLLTSSLCAPLVAYMPGVRKAVVCDLPRGRLPLGQYWELARRLRAENYGTALIMLRTWKAALAPFLAGIPERVGFVGEGRFGLINDLRWGERRLGRMIDRMGALALPPGAPLPSEWPLPELVIEPADLELWLARQGPAAKDRPVVALAPGAVGPGKRWPAGHFAEVAHGLTAEGVKVWVVGGPNEKPLAKEIAAAGGNGVRDLTGTDLGQAVLALGAADAAVSNDSGLMHVAAALGTPTIALFGPTAPRLWAPLNPLRATLEPPSRGADVRRRRVDDISPERVLNAVRAELAHRELKATR